MGKLAELRCIIKHMREFWTDTRRRARLYEFQRKWREQNPHNGTNVMNIFPIERVTVGGGYLWCASNNDMGQSG